MTNFQTASLYHLARQLELSAYTYGSAASSGTAHPQTLAQFANEMSEARKNLVDFVESLS